MVSRPKQAPAAGDPAPLFLNSIAEAQGIAPYQVKEEL